MNLSRRKFLHLTAGAAALLPASRFGWAQAYPTRPLRMLVGYPPGGGTDVAARLIGQGLSARLGQPIIIENRPGAGNTLAIETAARAAPDGYTLALVSGVTAMLVYQKLDVILDMTPVASTYRSLLVMVVNS